MEKREKKYYLRAITDVTFKRVFGEHANVCMSLLNAVLDLEYPIVELTYLQNELVASNEGKKQSVVDVHCKDQGGREFIVEMQTCWMGNIFDRVIYNSCKVFGNQLVKGADFADVKEVYSVNFVQKASFGKQYADGDTAYETDRCRSTFKITCSEDPSLSYDKFFVYFFDLSNFRAEEYMTGSEARMFRLWLSLLTKVNGKISDELEDELNGEDATKEALGLLDDSGYSETEKEKYEREIRELAKYAISLMEKDDELKEAKELLRERDEELRAKDEELKRERENKMEIVRRMLANGMDVETIAKLMGMKEEEIERIGI